MFCVFEPNATSPHVSFCPLVITPLVWIHGQDGVIHMGSVVYNKEAKDYTTNQLVIKNESPFELVYKLEIPLCKSGSSG